jgi:hypothetical protein
MLLSHPPVGRQRQCLDKKRPASASPQHRSPKVSRGEPVDENLGTESPVEKPKDTTSSAEETDEVFVIDPNAKIEDPLKYKSDFARRVSLNSNVPT